MHEVEYITSQIEANACVPIAVINALRWWTQSSRWGFNELREKFKELGWNPKSGCKDPDISRILRHFEIPYVYVPNGDLGTIERQLQAGSPLLLSYVWQQSMRRSTRKLRGHLVFVEKEDSPGYLKIYNVNGNGAERKEVLAKYLTYGNSSLWLLG